MSACRKLSIISSFAASNGCWLRLSILANAPWLTLTPNTSSSMPSNRAKEIA